jgi:crossover junction endodeoxyribonuclease RuvC
MEIKKKRVLGVDPALAKTGYGIIDEDKGRLNIITCGVITTDKNKTFAHRLETIFDEIREIIKKYNPDEVAVEAPFFAKDVSIAIKMGQANGVVVMASVKSGAKVFSYSALEIKQSVVGYGRADKAQVQNMVKNILHLDKIPEPNDAADALATAICHINYTRFKEKIEKT